MSESLVLLYVTIPHTETGTQMAEKLFEKNLIACANILPAHQSVYRWEGKLQQQSEHLMIIKTRKALAQKVETEITAMHPYDCPCILQLTPTHVNEPLMQWVQEETKN